VLGSVFRSIAIERVSMSKRQQVERLISDIRHQCAPGIHTVRTCQRCGKEPSRGGAACATCLTQDMAEITGHKAWEFLKLTRLTNKLVGEVLEEAEGS